MILFMAKFAPRTQKQWNNLIAIRDTMIYECTNSPTVIQRILKEAGMSMGRNTIIRCVDMIRNERQTWRDGLAKDVFETTIWDECIQINKEIKQMELEMKNVKPGMQMAGLANALTQHRMRREYVMSKLALLPRLVEIEHAKHTTPQRGIITKQ